MPNDQMCKRWMVTVFATNAPDNWKPSHPEGAEYSVWQKERCPETGRDHWHIYVRWGCRKRLSYMTRLYFQSHCEIPFGTEAECKAYCTKAESRIEVGEEHGTFEGDAGKQGKRSDLDAIGKAIKEGKSLAEIAESHCSDYIRYHGGIEATMILLQPRPPMARDISVIVLWGPTATGKTHRILTNYPDVYSANVGRDPWGQYRGELQILLDEFDYTQWPITTMNKVLDKWLLRLDARYRDRYAAWTLVAICANSPPGSWYPDATPMLQDAFRRRIRGRCWEVNSTEKSLEEIMNEVPTPL